MAPTGEEEVEYESDPEEVKRSLAMRRREASDDDDDKADGEDDAGRRGIQRTETHSDGSDGQGGVAEYDNDDEEGLGIDGEDRDGGFDEEEEYIEEGHNEEVDDDRERLVGNINRMAGGFEGNVMKSVDGDRTHGEETMEEGMIDLIDEEEEKEKEPFSVPTAGAFYMHDDRFQENSGGRHRRMRGGRRLWESKDDGKWGHDKFEEMNTRDKHYERRRTSRGQFRGRGQTRGRELGYTRGSSSNALSVNGNQNQFSKVAPRGRRPQRYETASRNENQATSAQNKQSRNSHEKNSHLDSSRVPTAAASSESEAGQAKKNTVASGLNSASPPFYPSGSSNSMAQKDIQVGMGRLHMNESTSPIRRVSGNAKMSSSGSSPVSTDQPSESMSKGRGAPAPGQVFYQQSLNQVGRTSPHMQSHGVSKGSGQSCLQPPDQAFDQHSTVIRPLASSPPKTSSSKGPYPSAEMESASETGALVAMGKGTLQPNGSSFLYGGTEVMGPAGSLAVGHGNPNFPAFLPLMPFGGQQGGVPTFGMAFPGYVQPEHGLGNPEMTWLPILTGPGALGATYGPPCAAIDGPYQACKPGLPSSAGPSSKENGTQKPDNGQKPSERPEDANNGIPQRQNNPPNKQPRRYSEMSFSK
ncbi:PREDICTED: protein CASC3-like [Tarenaya hassleriana]|uniref:protein CASC3-like n=1 Tax=Tarenaya hassleriana TaxID=28532 RepID=UPI00053C40BD|nr:PREDICTED: protein CASC3-like [Tarenaya hassleriana]XP_010539502.1 PREDICTED: protein CASC3-like [Tarenaya hassleriana]